MSTSEADDILVKRIRSGDETAWNDLIARYEGRLLAFVDSRLGKSGPAEDIVQETFVGFLNSLPNYDGQRPLEGYLFSICAYKLTDHLRREGRRPALPLSKVTGETSGDWDVAGSDRAASSIARSGERKSLEENALADALKDQVEKWKDKGEWAKLKCAELLFVRGWANKDVATELQLSEQHVANYKFEFIAKMRTAIRKQQPSQEIFPELYDDKS